MIQYTNVTECKTDGQTDRHCTTAKAAVGIRSLICRDTEFKKFSCARFVSYPFDNTIVYKSRGAL